MLTKNRRISLLAMVVLAAGITIAIVYTGRRHESAPPLGAVDPTTLDNGATPTPRSEFRPLVVDPDTLRFELFSRQWTYGAVRPLKDGSVLITNGESPHPYLVAADGVVDGTGFPISGGAEVGISDDETRLAWASFDMPSEPVAIDSRSSG